MGYEILDLDIKNKFIGKKIIRYKTISSTQEKCLYLLENFNGQSNLNGTVIVSDQQTAGKGRLQRKWVSSNGGLWFSIILTRPNLSVSDINFIHMLSTLSVCETIKIFIDYNTVIKWPNDIMVNSKKIAGILIDVSITDEKIDYLVIGIGINVNLDSKQVIKEIQKDNEYNMNSTFGLSNDITSIKDELKGLQVDKLKILRILLEKIEKYFLTIERSILDERDNDNVQKNSIPHNKHKIIAMYRGLCSTLGKRICVYNTGKEYCCGLAKGLDEHGYLILEKEGVNKDKEIVVEKLYYGDISIREI